VTSIDVPEISLFTSTLEVTSLFMGRQKYPTNNAKDTAPWFYWISIQPKRKMMSVEKARYNVELRASSRKDEKAIMIARSRNNKAGPLPASVTPFNSFLRSGALIPRMCSAAEMGTRAASQSSGNPGPHGRDALPGPRVARAKGYLAQSCR
jgi:hypothetical protein